MAEIVLGMATSHGPMLSTPPEKWALRVGADRQNARHFFKGKTYKFDELTALRAAERLDLQITPEVWRTRHAACQTAISTLAEVYAEVKPDVAVIVGNDQMEIFTDATIPAFSVFWGDSLVNEQPDHEYFEKLGPGLAIAIPG